MRGLAMLVGLAVVAACGGGRPPATTTATTPDATTATVATARPATSAAATSAPYLTMALVDVRTGERFTLGGFPGKTVIVQGMAVW